MIESTLNHTVGKKRRHSALIEPRTDLPKLGPTPRLCLDQVNSYVDAPAAPSCAAGLPTGPSSAAYRSPAPAEQI